MKMRLTKSACNMLQTYSKYFHMLIWIRIILAGKWYGYKKLIITQLCLFVYTCVFMLAQKADIGVCIHVCSCLYKKLMSVCVYTCVHACTEILCLCVYACVFMLVQKAYVHVCIHVCLCLHKKLTKVFFMLFYRD